jgi:endonuclease/exonuclease/phosphatase (EEP) superfamily protein YafD
VVGPNKKALLILIALHGVLLVVISAVNHLGAEHWWLGALNLYLPQVFWAAPAALLLLVSFRAGWRWAWLPLLYLAWVLGPIMGFCWSRQTPPGPMAGPALRVMTCNAKYGKRDSAELLSDIQRYRPDLVLLQDANGCLQGPPGRFFREWNVYFYDQFVIASRLPFSAAVLRQVPLLGGTQTFFRAQVTLGSRTITLYNVHFQSPRDSLNAFRTEKNGRLDLLSAIQELEHNAAVRLAQAEGLRDLVRAERGPVIIAGDLNSPDASRVCATLREAGLRDAFEAGGRGYGYTYGHFLLQYRLPWLRLSWMRIDHIMAGGGLTPWHCWVGTGRASDHRPVLADLSLGNPSANP